MANPPPTSSRNESGDLPEFSAFSPLNLPRPPFWLTSFVIIATVATLVPLALIARARFSTTEKPRVHIFQDMGNQPRFGPQQQNKVFADTRSDRPVIEGTVARANTGVNDDAYNLGFTRTWNASAGKWDVQFVEAFPAQLKVDATLLARGQDRFGIYCTSCHGQAGAGNGLVQQHASALALTDATVVATWVQPSNIADETRRGRPVGHLYNTINNGIRSMGGLGHQIPAGDRWAIVAYVRAIQLSQAAPKSLLSADDAKGLK